MSLRFYVYEHIRKDNNKVFYVGKGASRKNRKTKYERAFATYNRSCFWKNVVKKSNGYEVRIVEEFATNEEACKKEIELIATHGRNNLCNLTDGGEGGLGRIDSEETKIKRSLNARGKRPESWVNSIRQSRKNGGNGGVVKKGDKLPEQWKRNISLAVSGNKNHMFGRKGKDHPNSRKVKNINTGNIFDSVSEAATILGINMKSLYNMLSGHRKNKTNLIFIN